MDHGTQADQSAGVSTEASVEFRRGDVYQLRSANHHHLIVPARHYHPRVDVPDAAVADLAEEVGRALLRFAARLRSSSPAEETAPADADIPAPPPPAPAADAAGPTPATPGQRGLGASQRRVLEAVQAAGDIGVTASQVAETTGLKSTNTPRMLKALAERGLLSSWGANPIIWRTRTS